MLNILIGNLETAGLMSYDTGTSVSLVEGEWAEFSSGKLRKQTGVIAAGSRAFPVFAGNSVRFDAKTLGKATVVTARGGVFETDKFAAESIVAGDKLTLENGVLRKVVTTDPVVAHALTANSSGVLQFSIA